MDIQLWRIRIGMFNGNSRSCFKSPSRLATSKSASLPHLLDIFLHAISLIDIFCELFIHFLLLTIIVLEICCQAFLYFFNISGLSDSTQAPSSRRQFFHVMLLIFNFNLPSLLIIIRLLLLLSGNVEPNPGPPPLNCCLLVCGMLIHC